MSNLIQGGLSAAAGATIPTTAFVKTDTTRTNQVLPAGVGDFPCGITQRWPNSPVLDPTQALPPAAAIGQQLCYYGPGVRCQLTAGATAWAPGDKLKPDANSCGVPTTTTGDIYGAIAITATPAGQIGEVTVVRADKL